MKNNYTIKEFLSLRGCEAQRFLTSCLDVATKCRGDFDLNLGMEKKIPNKLKSAAVLVPIVDRKESLAVILTRRTDNLATHPGQISFPGGHVEDGDSGPEQTALREANEEIGLDSKHVRILGRLDNYKTRTGFNITPVVSFLSLPPEIKKDSSEVEEIFEVPLSFLLDPANHHRHKHLWKDRALYFYAIPYLSYYIWGATAGILVNLFDRLHNN